MNLWRFLRKLRVQSREAAVMSSSVLRASVLCLCVCSALLTSAVAQSAPGSLNCDSHRADCHTCISAGCVWCMPPLGDASSPTCSPPSASACPPSWTAEDPPSSVEPVEGPEPGDYSIYITPQRWELNLRVGRPEKVPLRMTISQNQELDLYYLTDISNTMEDDLKLIQTLGYLLSEDLKDRTSKFSIGFGTFVDKNILPFTYHDGLEPKPSPHGCDPVLFGFCNAMTLTENGGDQFNNITSLAETVVNKDLLEGGLDALLQAMVCGEAIGWRRTARRVLLLATDGPYHIAGDGKLAGISEVNDERCHLDALNRTYTHTLLQDYPSAAQIDAAAKKYGINIIFAVTKEVMPLYEVLAAHISDATSAEITSDSSNIQNIIVEQFDSIVSTVTLSSSGGEEDVEVEFAYDCPSGGPDTCDGLKLGTTVDVTATVTLKSCKGGTRSIYLDSIALQERVELLVTPECDCQCDSTGIEPESEMCSYRGTLRCGKCYCHEGIYGERCHCSGEEEAHTESCKAPNSTQTCGGAERGQCVCGVCECVDLGDGRSYSGDYCECSNYECPRANGALCGGRGRCACGVCLCDDGWGDPACTCAAATDGCVDPDSESMCSDRGACKCNACQCDLTGNGNERYIGRYCEDCPTCSGRCEDMATCAKCHLLAEGDSTVTDDGDVCPSASCQGISVKDEKAPNGTSLCYLYTPLCSRSFHYRLGGEDSATIYLVDEWTCRTPIWVIIVSVVGSIVGVGILTLAIWMVVDTRREAKRLEKMKIESEAAMRNATNMNQMYKDPMMQVQNPMFGRNI